MIDIPVLSIEAFEPLIYVVGIAIGVIGVVLAFVLSYLTDCRAAVPIATIIGVVSACALGFGYAYVANTELETNAISVQAKLDKVDGYSIDLETLKTFLYGEDKDEQQKVLYLQDDNGEIVQVVLMKDNGQVGVFPVSS